MRVSGRAHACRPGDKDGATPRAVSSSRHRDRRRATHPWLRILGEETMLGRSGGGEVKAARWDGNRAARASGGKGTPHRGWRHGVGERGQIREWLGRGVQRWRAPRSSLREGRSPARIRRARGIRLASPESWACTRQASTDAAAGAALVPPPAYDQRTLDPPAEPVPIGYRTRHVRSTMSIPVARALMRHLRERSGRGNGSAP